jgi:hypothetical protein
MAQFCANSLVLSPKAQDGFRSVLNGTEKISAHLAARNPPLAPRAMGMAYVWCSIFELSALRSISFRPTSCRFPRDDDVATVWKDRPKSIQHPLGDADDLYVER